MAAVLFPGRTADPSQVFSFSRSEIWNLALKVAGKYVTATVPFDGKDLGTPLREAASRAGPLHRVLIMGHGPLNTSSWSKADFWPVHPEGRFYLLSCHSVGAACKIAGVGKRVAFGLKGEVAPEDVFLGVEKGEDQLYAISPTTGAIISRKAEPMRYGGVEISMPPFPIHALADLSVESIRGDRYAGLYWSRITGNAERAQWIRWQLAAEGDLSAQEVLFYFATTPEERKISLLHTISAALQGSPIAIGALGFWWLDKDPSTALRVIEIAQKLKAPDLDWMVAEYFYRHATAERGLPWVIDRLERAIDAGHDAARIARARVLIQVGRKVEAEAEFEKALGLRDEEVTAQAREDLARLRSSAPLTEFPDPFDTERSGTGGLYGRMVYTISRPV